jgi:uncharacterized protein
MPISTFTHGVYPKIQPTILRTVVTANSAAIVAVGTAPVHRLPVASFAAGAWSAYVNKPLLCGSLKDCERLLGSSGYEYFYSLSRCLAGFFVYGGVSPVIFINVFDPFVDNTPTTYTAPVTSGNNLVLIPDEIIPSSLVVKNAGGTATYIAGTDYLFSYASQATLQDTFTLSGSLTLLTSGIQGQTSLTLTYSKPNVAGVDYTDIIGGVDSSGNNTGLECVGDVFPATAIVPGILIAPEFSFNALVAGVMKAKTYNINNRFSCVAYAEVDNTTSTSEAAAIAWKSTNNYSDPQLTTLWPRRCIDLQHIFAPEVELAQITAQTDVDHRGIPFASPSNKNSFCTQNILYSGAPIDISLDDADYLNGNGITTYINYGSGWKSWGNRQSCYGPSGDTDPVDMWLNVRRMLIWMGNTLILTLMQFTDQPGNQAGVDSVVETFQQWLNSLVAAGALLPGAICLFTPADNQLTDVLNGIFTFEGNVAVPIPMETLRINLSYDTTQLQAFINNVGLAAT